MSDKVKLRIDGVEVEAPAGSNLIEAAKIAGIHIPNLCYVKGMKGIGACRLCLVEVEGQKAPVIACNTKVKEGMSLNTKTPDILEARKFIIDLILSMHPLDCMTCTKAGVCSLQQYAYDFEIKQSSFTRKRFGYPTDEANPFIKRDPEYCILCGRCVRVCRENGTSVLEFMGRGVGAKVVTAKDEPLQSSGCTFCGSCLDACPVNALLEADRWRKGRQWEYSTVDTNCLMCSGACDITVSTKDGMITKINAASSREGSSENYICAYGRFGFDSLTADTRLITPMKKAGGKLKETTWEDALGLAADALKKAGKEAAFLTAASVTNEDALTLKALASLTGSSNIASTLSVYSDEDCLRESASADIDAADLIVLVGLAPDQWQREMPALDVAIRRRTERGAKLIVINSREARISDVASIKLPGSETATIKALIKGLLDKGVKIGRTLQDAVSGIKTPSEDEAMAAEMFAAAGSPLVLASPGLFSASSNLAFLKGKAVAVPLESNSRGLALAGFEKGFDEVTGGKSKALLVMGVVPVNKRPATDFLIVAQTHLTELAKEADIVLPMASFLEAAGSVLDYMGRLKRLTAAVAPPAEARGGADILVAIGGKMGLKIKKPVEAEVKRALKVSVKPSAKPFSKRDFEVAAKDFVESANASAIAGSRLLWLKEAGKATV